MNILSSKLSLFDTKEFQKVFELKQQLTNPIDLSVGIPEELTPDNVKAAGKQAIDDNRTIYTPANGVSELREAIAENLRNKNSIDATPDNIAIVPGLTTGQLILYMAILDTDDEIIIIDPYYPPYPHLATLIGAKAIIVNSLDNFQLDLEEIQKKITKRTKAILINTPNNPTGVIYDETSLRRLAQIAEKNELLVLSDEIYEDYTFDQPHFSIASIYSNTITMGGFSKSHAMTGWRIGYITGPSSIIQGVSKLLQYCVFSSSSVSQFAALEATKTPPATNRYALKRDFIAQELKRIGFEVNGGGGAFYLFVRTPNDIDGERFAELAALENLIVVPGSAFSSRKNYFRLSYGAPMADLEKSIPVFEKLHKKCLAVV